MHPRVLQSCGLYPEKYSVVVWYDLLPTSSVVRVCWLNFGLLTLSLSSFPFYFLQYRAWNRLIYRGIKYLRICSQSFVLPALLPSQVRWRGLQGVQSPIAVAMGVCASDNFVIAVAIAVLRKKQSTFYSLQVDFARFSNHGSLSRKHHWHQADEGSPFASSSWMVKQSRKWWCENIVVSAPLGNRRGVSHTPWCERTLNDGSEQNIIV